MEFVIRPTIRRELLVIFISAIVVFAVLLFVPVAPEMKYPVAAAVLLIAILTILYYQFKTSNEYLKVSEHGVEYKKGWMITKKITISFDKIQEISIKRGIMDNILGLAIISIDTAGTPDIEVYDDRFDANDAEEFVKRVNKFESKRMKKSVGKK